MKKVQYNKELYLIAVIKVLMIWFVLGENIVGRSIALELNSLGHIYIYRIFMMLAEYIDPNKTELIFSILFKLLISIFDVYLVYILSKILNYKDKEIAIFLILSPILIYGVYKTNNLDILAIGVLLYSVNLLIKKKYALSSIILALSFVLKNPAIFSVPLILIYIYKTTREVKKVLGYGVLFCIIYACLYIPLWGEIAYGSILNDVKSLELITKTVYQVGSLKIYTAPAMIIIIYVRFMAYKKVNKELLFHFMGLIYAIFVLLIPPMSNWYLWAGVFISILFINKYQENKNIIYIHLFMSIAYVFYFGKLYNRFEFLLNSEEVARNIAFTNLEVMLIVCCYALYKFGVKSNSVYKNDNEAIIIGIGGDSGAGKTTLKKSIMSLVGRTRITEIEADGDHKWERGDSNWNEFTHLNPKANYLYKQANYLKELKKGNDIKRVEYDHSTGKFTDPVKVSSNDYILVAGLHPLYLPQTRRIMDIKIYLDTDERLRRHWKIIRDTQKRGYSTEKILEQIESRMGDAKKYIYTQKQFADYIINYFTDDEFELGNPDFDPEIKLKIQVSAELDLDNVIEHLYMRGISVDHSFDEDLKHQTIILSKPLEEEILEEIMKKNIENIEEIINENDLEWSGGYHSFIQLILLFMIVDKMKGNVAYEI